LKIEDEDDVREDGDVVVELTDEHVLDDESDKFFLLLILNDLTCCSKL
jgi:hypothetical protein